MAFSFSFFVDFPSMITINDNFPNRTLRLIYLMYYVSLEKLLNMGSKSSPCASRHRYFNFVEHFITFSWPET